MKHRCLILAVVALCAAPLAAFAALKEKPEKPLHVSEGAKIDLSDYLVPGKTTVFDFYSKYCGPCMRIAPEVEKIHATRADVVVVKVDINRPDYKGIDWRSPVAEQFGLRSIPHFKVYGPDGKLVAEDGPDSHKASEIVFAMFR